MQQIGLWHVTAAGPRKLKSAQIDLEQHLEGWIERDPALLESGLTIVGRQIKLDAGPLDLLALDPQGQWIVVELKRGPLYRETVAQAIDYASCIATMPFEQLAAKVNEYLGKLPEREPQTLDKIIAERAGGESVRDTPRDVRIYVVGTGRDPGLDRVVRYLAESYDVPISVVSYQVFESATGERILVRELTETEPGVVAPDGKSDLTLETVCAKADRAGIGTPFRAILEAARRNGLYPRPYKNSVMYTPPSKRTRCLFTAWAETTKAGELYMYVAADAIAQFYPATEEGVVRELGWSGWRKLSPSEIDLFATNLDHLFAAHGKQQTGTLTASTVDGTMLASIETSVDSA